MTNKRAIELLKIERECVNRNNQPFGKNCDRHCSKCDLVQNTEDFAENEKDGTIIEGLYDRTGHVPGPCPLPDTQEHRAAEYHILTPFIISKHIIQLCPALVNRILHFLRRLTIS